MAHRLDPLLKPASIAVLGASQRPGVGQRALRNLVQGGFGGPLYAVNPGYREVCGVPCVPSLDDLPEPVEHVVFAVSDPRVEAALEQVIAHGARAATLMSQLVLADDPAPTLLERVRARILEAGLLLCGGNAMGFYNCRDGVWACGFDTRDNHPRGGHVTLISQSGSGMSGIVDCEERIDFNLAVSTGQELSVGLHDYMDFAIEAHAPRAIGLFMETVRDPAGMCAVLDKAQRRNVPVVALKVGRTALAARLALSHSGAIAGSDAAYQALFDRYGVQRVHDMDELASALIMFAQPHEVAPGALVAMHDSGGERQLLIDLADAMEVPLTELAPATVRALGERLDPGLPPVNPLDAWGAGGPDADAIMEDCLAALMGDPGAALGAVIHDRSPFGRIYPAYIDYLRKAHAATGKPVFLVANRQGTGTDPAVVAVTREGFPVLDGLRPFLAGVRCLLAMRDFRARTRPELPTVDPEVAARWRERLAGGGALDEVRSLAMLGDFGLPVNPALPVTSREELLAAAARLGYPLVLKTAKAGLHHKTEAGGVRLDLPDEAALLDAYASLCERVGPQALVARMVQSPGLELLLGMVRDEQFGPLVTLGFGGIDVEQMRDFACAMPPFDAATAHRLLATLRRSRMLAGGRRIGTPAIEAYCEMASRFSVMVDALAEVLEEIDINPVIVHATGCIGVDALVVARRS